MKTSILLATTALIILSSCTTEDSRPKRPDTSSMSPEAAKLWEGVQFSPLTPEQQYQKEHPNIMPSRPVVDLRNTEFRPSTR